MSESPLVFSTIPFGIDENKIISLINCFTLESFLQAFLDKPIPQIASEENLVRKFKDDQKTINQSSLVSKTQLHNTYFQKWQTFGDNVLEDTKGIISGDPLPTEKTKYPGDRGKFRKLNFANESDITKFPDLTLRLPAGATSEDPGAVWRLCPWAVVAYLDLKATNVDVSSHCCQGLLFAQSTLLCCPLRDYCLCAIYNFRSLIFCGVKSVDGVLSYFNSGVIRNSEASVEIAKFLSCPRDLLGFVDCYPFTDYPPHAALGRGSAAVCVSVDQGNKAMKVSRDTAALSQEREILNYLRFYAQQCSPPISLPIPRVIDSNQHYTLMEPVYDRPSSSLTILQFLKAWGALHEVHKFGICHCDVRMPNLRVIGGTTSQTFHWIDWSAARPFRNDLPSHLSQSLQVGSTCTASIPVLTRMLTKKHDYQCFPSDEGISMIYLYWQHLEKSRSLQIPHPPDVAIEIWKNAATAFPPEVTKEVAALEAIGQSYDEEALKTIKKSVESALQAISNHFLSLKASADFADLD
jgi:hypothetical protein